MKGRIHFNDGSCMDLTDIVNVWFDDYGVHTNALDGKLFIPYGSIKFISEEHS